MRHFTLVILFLFHFIIPLTASSSISEITPDAINTLRDQGKIKEAKALVNKWIKETESEYGDDAIENVIPLLASAELSIIYYEYPEAVQSLEKVLGIIDLTSGWLYPDYALALNYLAYCKVNMGDKFAAFGLLNEAEMIYYKTLTQQHPDFNLCNINRAILNLHLGEFEKSESYFLKSYQFIEDHKEAFATSKTASTITIDWLNIKFAQLYTKWYKPEKALPLLESAQAGLIKRGWKKSPIYSILLENLAEHYYYSNNYKMAYSFYEELHSHRKEFYGENHIATAKATLEMGEIMSQTGYINNALSYFQQANKLLSKEKGYVNSKAEILLHIADVYLQKGDAVNAKEYFDNVKIETTTNRDLYFFYLRVMGDLYYINGDYINAELKLMELVSIVRQERVFFTKHYSKAIVTLTELFVTLGRLQNAIGLCENEVNFLKKRGRDKSVTYLDLRLTLLTAQWYEKLIDETEAMAQITNIEDTLVRFVNPNHPLFIKTNTLKGGLCSDLLKYDEAISYFRKALDFANQHGVEELHFQRIQIIDYAGNIYIKKRELEKALTEYRVLKGKFTDESVYFPGFLGRIAYVKALQGKWEEAKELIIRGVDIRFHQYDTQLNFTSEDEKINYVHHTSLVFKYFFSLMSMPEGYKSPLMVEKCYDLQVNYRKYFLKEAIARKKKIENLGQYRKSMNFTNYNQHLDQQKSKLATANFFSIKERNDLNIDTYMLTDRINNLEKSLSFASKSDDDSLNVSEYISWRDVQKRLNEKEVALEIIKLNTIDKNNDFYVAIAISKNCKTPKFIPIGNAKLLENDLFSIYSKEIKPKTRSLVYKKTTTKKVSAYKYYWEPIKEGLAEWGEEIGTIYLSKDGIYNAINLNVLYNSESEKYLIEEEDIHLVISTSDIRSKSQLSNFTNNDICLFGNPSFEGDAEDLGVREAAGQASADQEKYTFYLENLPGTKTELENTQTLFKSRGWNVDAYYEDRATENNIKNLSYSPSIMHIATHGIYIDELINPILQNPLLKSGLFFTEISTNNEKSVDEIYKSGNDGILTAYEVKGLNLKNTSLLILSACQSGVSDIADGDGISGLQYAFSIAGVKTIVMSLWSVDDVATQKLMNEFYEQWFQTKDIDQAFRNAQLKLMKDYKDPYYWGAFVMVH
ncbi:CHAT domain-containing protein [Flammeovirga sp. EKP202]|uniref:CHAT domain-containing protein n=1 Tax=Flammeovirga sp. EKP202 TaxID=2770592 RepID=UPI00165F7107|nr:CHAT domain-containing protein [Flammeovirga sp. EKP202]MBD0401040.1 CHAT domain-containing protein [Flammeovirga sp. EKP202]